jgi:hypothetical protein
MRTLLFTQTCRKCFFSIAFQIRDIENEKMTVNKRYLVYTGKWWQQYMADMEGGPLVQINCGCTRLRQMHKAHADQTAMASAQPTGKSYGADPHRRWSQVHMADHNCTWRIRGAHGGSVCAQGVGRCRQRSYMKRQSTAEACQGSKFKACIFWFQSGCGGQRFRGLHNGNRTKAAGSHWRPDSSTPFS